ncbi:MAG: segregation/condensation protein A [Anaerolineae bacterium]|nr:MAG: segregation/condensation protein A [Anaerolineae bacterium]
MSFLHLSDETYRVRLPLFEGPLDLLLHLIEREELDITKISLAQVTDQYLAYISRLEELNPETLADFLVIAARLLLIKSQVLLPRPETELPAADKEDPGEALARQLREYKRFKEVAQYLKERAASGFCTFVRIAPPPELPRSVDLSGVSLNDLLVAWQQALLTQLPEQDLRVPSPQPTITIGDKIALIRRRLAQQDRVTFSSLLIETSSRLAVIVTFIALLEMLKSQEVTLHQEAVFGEIFIIAVPPASTLPSAREV